MLARRLACVATVVALAAGALAGCSSTTAKPNRADAAFLQDMIEHHTRAIAVARIGRQQAHDPRVQAFAERIVAEQSPELARMKSRVTSAHLRINAAAGIAMAMNRITDAQVAALRALTGVAFDRQFLALNINSEQGAAAMARAELAHGRDAVSRQLAHGIAGAPTSEIPELRKLAGQLG